MVNRKDKKGGDAYPRRLVESFNEALVDAGLKDMDLVRHPFTWKRGRGTTVWMEVWLDRAVTTESWLNMFLMVKLYNLEGSTLDHIPIILVPKKNDMKKSHEKFKFKNAWLLDPMCYQLVEECWIRTTVVIFNTN